MAKSIILVIDVIFTIVVAGLLDLFGKDFYDSSKKKMKFCYCKTFTEEERDKWLKRWIIVLTALHLLDSVLSLFPPIGDLIYLSRSDKVVGSIGL